jgi:hypothetical protein
MFKQWKEYYQIKRSGLFDPAYYLLNNPDVRIADVDPLTHFIEHGWREGRNPSHEFDTNYYLETNPDVNQSGMNLLVHYLRHGKLEGRAPNPYFNGSQYLEMTPKIKETGLDPLIHHLLIFRENENASVITPNQSTDDFWLDEDTLELISDLTR